MAKKDTLDLKALAKKYGVAAATLNGNKELTDIFKLAIARNWAEADILNAISNSGWGQNHTKTWIEIEKERLAQPKIWDAVIAKTSKTIRDQYIATGAEPPSDEELATIAAQTLHGGDLVGGKWENYDAAWLQQKIASAIDFSNTMTVGGVTLYDLSGKAEAVATSLYDTAYKYGLDTTMSNESFTNWFKTTAKAITEGTMAAEDADDEAMKMAVSRFPSYASAAARGVSLLDWASPWLTVAHDVLGDANIGLNDDLVAKMLNGVTKDGQPQPMSLYDAKLAARSDKRWMYTEQAKNEYTDLGSKILKDFGFLG